MPLENYLPMSLTKSQLTKAIAFDTGFSQKKTSEILAVLLKILTATLASGDSISLRGFGKFYLRDQKERTIRHPLTGKIINVSPKSVVKFKSFKFLREAINDFGSIFDAFKQQNKIILQQLYDLIIKSSDYEEDDEEETVLIFQKHNDTFLHSVTSYICKNLTFLKYRYLR
jgi:DNA-binding protein HU-beta